MPTRARIDDRASLVRARSAAGRYGVLWSGGRRVHERATYLRGSSALETVAPQGDRCGNCHRRSGKRVSPAHAGRGGCAGPVVPHRARHRRNHAGLWRESTRWATSASAHTCRGRPSGTGYRRSRLYRLPAGLRRSARAHQRWTRVAPPRSARWRIWAASTSNPSWPKANPRKS
jgi:hypothetical protein